VIKPIIGIGSDIHSPAGKRERAFTYLTYVEAVRRAGAIPVLIPPQPENAGQLMRELDGFLLAGGDDCDPAVYGEARHATVEPMDARRQANDLALAEAARKHGVPMLGICLGLQVMNVAAGGTLLQHLPESHGHHEHRRTPGSFDGADHDVRLNDGSLAARAAGEVVHGTKSHHHQAVDRVAEGFEVTGWSSIDELPEAFEAPERRFALGVQWHPEADERSRLIGALVAEAAAARNGSR